MASQRESERVIHNGLRAQYRMTHKESERCSKHNDDVETIVGKTGVRPCEHEKRGQKRKKMCGNENVGNSHTIPPICTAAQALGCKRTSHARSSYAL